MKNKPNRMMAESGADEAVTFTITVSVEAGRISGRFASREEIEQAITEAITKADPSSILCKNGGEYVTLSWKVQEVTK